MSVPDSVVFDTEPLVAYADGETGSDTVATYLDAVVHGEANGICNFVNASEVRYILARKYDRDVADRFLRWLWTIGIEAVDAETVWERASEYVIDHNPALGDAYALATAEAVTATLLVGGDDDYDDVTTADIERFRTHGV